MKRALTIIFGTILVISLHAQTGVFYTYGYDSAGNRTLRNYVSPINSPTPVLTDCLPSQSIVPKAVTKRYSSQDVFLLSSEKESDKEFEKYVSEWESAMRELLKKKGSAQPDRSTYDFGAIPCQDGVSPSGARTYTVPIPVAPGTKMAPSIALGYNSQAGDGWAGFGWDIQGISTITVINKNIYYHGVAEAADTWQTDAVFALDGIPLVTNTNTANNSVYPLVTASGHIFVKRNDNSQGKPDTFTVLYPDGSIATYGFGCISNFYYPAYPIVEREDILGNLCTYTYHHNLIDGHYYPDTIEYGYQSGGTPQGKIVFNYNSRTDYTLRYYAGRKIYTDQILSSISSRSGSENMCTYWLYYTQTDNTELLTEIRCQSSMQYIPPLSFTYGDPTLPQSGQIMKSSNSVSLSTWFDSNSKYLLRRGKFMSNNYGDCLLAYLDLKNYAVTHYHPQVSPPAMFYEYGSQYASDRRLNILCRTSDGGYTSVDNSIAVGSGFQTAEPVDVDGDGVDEIVKVNFDGTSNNKTVLRLTTYKCNTSGTPVQQNTFTVSINGTVTSGSYVSPSRRVYYWGDFLCNGKTQLLALATDNTGCGANQTQTCYASLIDIEGQTVLSDSVLFTFPFSDAEHNTFAIDLDSDGKTELCHATTQGLDVYSVGTSNTFALETTYTDITSSILSSTTSPVLNLADVNGDGYVDIVTLPFMLPSGSISSSDEWTVYYFTGHSFMIDTLPITTRSATDKYFLIDVDRDGMADLVKIALGDNNSSSFGVYLNQNGSTFSSYVQSTDTISSTNHIVPINGMEYNLASCFIAIDGSTLQDYSYTRPAPLVRRTASMTDSYGRVLTSMYRYLPDRSTSWTTSSYTPTTADGYTKKVIPVYVLEVENAYLTSSLTNKYRYNIYAYDDLVLHSWGLGFCGFVQTRTRDAYHYPHYCTITTYDPEKRGVVTRVQTGLQVFAAVPFKSVDYTYDSHFTTYGKLNPRLIESVAEDGLTGITTTTEYDSFNNYDFPQYILTTRSDGSATHTQLCRRFYQNVVSTTRSVLGILTEERIWQEASSSQTGTWNERDYYSYNSSYLPVSRWHYVGQVSSGTSATNLESTTQWTYDTYGNVLSEESAPYNVTTFLGTSYTYDNDGRFLISSTDEFGHTTSFSGYNKYGKPTSVTDYQGRSNSMSYDSWGNLVSTTYADGTVETTSTDWGGNGLYRVSHTRTGMMPERTDYDALGREVHHGVQRYNDAWLQVDRLYDSNGYLWKVSLPYRYNGPAYWNRYSYDVYGRKTAYWEASGRTTSWSYYGTDVTTEEDGIATTRTTDPSGRLIAITDDGGTVTYNLRDDGQPLSITAPGNVVTSFTYDAFGRRTQLSDPSAGTQSDSWTWYADGTSSHTHTNANGSITTYNDPHGRPTYVSHPSGYSGYTYDSYDRLSQVDSDSGASVSYTYDAYDRIATLQLGAPDSKYQKKTYTYGSGSVVSSIKYTSQDGDMATENYTYSNGQLTSIRLNNNQYIWSLSNENDFGQTTQCTTLGITRQYGYDAYGYPTSRSITNSGITLQDFSYVIDPETGNLTSRTDETRNITESFTYDSLNGLSYIGSNPVTYNGKGNITSIGQVGSMLYGNSSAPYRISAFIPENGVSIRPHSQSVTYMAFDRPSTITENDTSATLTYDTDGQRVMMVVAVNNVETMRRYYMDDRYEIDQASSTTTERLYLGGDAYSAPVVMQRTGNGSWSMYLLGRDNQGSVTHVISSSGTLLYEYSYTPWGGLRNPATQVVYTPGAEPALFTGRGYTGHEHLNEFGLINMNARLYDPLLGRFLSPDPYVQAPDFSQNFNRYAYALNNPLKYVDRDGEEFTIGTLLLVAGISAAVFGTGNLVAHAVRNDDLGHGNWAKYFFSGALAGFVVGAATYGGLWGLYSMAGMSGALGKIGSFLYKGSFYAGGTHILSTVTSAIGGSISYGSNGIANTGKILLGNFYLDENKSFLGQVWEGISRHTWQGPQTSLGYNLSQFRNAFGGVDRVDYLGGATFSTDEYSEGGGMSLGNFITYNYSDKIIGDFDSFVQSRGGYMHEYGHYIDSQLLGVSYLLAIGLPSAISASRDDKEYFSDGSSRWLHNSYKTETRANINASRYFGKYYSVSWDPFIFEYPL